MSSAKFARILLVFYFLMLLFFLRFGTVRDEGSMRLVDVLFDRWVLILSGKEGK